MINSCPVKFYGRILGFHVTITRVLGFKVKVIKNAPGQKVRGVIFDGLAGGYRVISNFAQVQRRGV